jgi:hypothetical protein
MKISTKEYDSVQEYFGKVMNYTPMRVLNKKSHTNVLEIIIALKAIFTLRMPI